MSGPKPRPLAERFWEKVDQSGECWLWTGGTDPNGYGRLTVAGKNSPSLAHRLSWELTNGPIPAGLGVLHACDNPPCVRPAHLWVGTHAENVRDMATKGRGRKRGSGRPGSSNAAAKLTEAQIPTIRAARASGRIYADLAATYGVSIGTIWGICTGVKWTHVP